jgi:hypothetical protein
MGRGCLQYGAYNEGGDKLLFAIALILDPLASKSRNEFMFQSTVQSIVQSTVQSMVQSSVRSPGFAVTPQSSDVEVGPTELS